MTQETGVLNPDLETIMVGRRSLHPVEFTPLSIADMKRLSATIDATIQTFFGSHPDLSEVTSMEALPFIKALIGSELGRILALAIGEEDVTILSGAKEYPLLDEMTMEQLMNAAELIYKQNFEVVGKKFVTLLPKFQSLLTSLSTQP